ncbi:MAG: sigma-70 family RNA polymerase sigma factor [Isosphaeraceae bacterium]
MGSFTMFATRVCDSTLSPAREAGWSGVALLVERAQLGDREAFGQLVEQFQRTVYSDCMGRLGNPSEAAELTQDVFLHVLRRIHQLREPERFAGWIRQVAVRMAINRATRKVAPSSVEDEVLEGAGSLRQDPLDELIARERAERLWEGLGRLKPLDRETLVAFYIQGQSLIEMAERLETPVGTIKRRLHTARKRLATVLRAQQDGDDWAEGSAEEIEDDELLVCS